MSHYLSSIIFILTSSVADPDPGSGIRDPVLFDPWIRDPESGMDKNSGSGSGINNPNHIPESLETVKFFDADPYLGSDIRNLFDPGSGIRDPGWKN